jgi:hypothetical protein
MELWHNGQSGNIRVTPCASQLAELGRLVRERPVVSHAYVWQAFGGDPEWRKAKADSKRDGMLVKSVTSQNLTPTDYSPAK